LGCGKRDGFGKSGGTHEPDEGMRMYRKRMKRERKRRYRMIRGGERERRDMRGRRSSPGD